MIARINFIHKVSCGCYYSSTGAWCLYFQHYNLSSYWSHPSVWLKKQTKNPFLEEKNKNQLINNGLPDGLLPLGLADLGLLVSLGHNLSQGGPSDGPLEFHCAAGTLLSHLFLLEIHEETSWFLFWCDNISLHGLCQRHWQVLPSPTSLHWRTKAV